MNHRAAAEGVPLVRPMYHLAPGRSARLRGAEPVRVRLRAARRADHDAARPGDAARRRARVAAARRRGSTCSPATVYDGDREVELHRDSGSIPALLRAGGILPLAAEDDLDATRNPERLELLVAPGADGAFTLVEDDGTGTTPDDDPDRAHDARLAAGRRASSRSAPPTTRTASCRATRTWTVTFLGAGDGSGLDGRRRADRSSRSASTAAPPGARARTAARRRCSRSSTRRSTGTRQGGGVARP